VVPERIQSQCHAEQLERDVLEWLDDAPRRDRVARSASRTFTTACARTRRSAATPMPSRKSSRSRPFRFEQLGLGSDKPGLVAGVDEAGRGPLAGPVVAAAVILDDLQPIRGPGRLEGAHGA
jgi:hypothetical protein